MKRLALNLLIALYVTGCGAADDAQTTQHAAPIAVQATPAVPVTEAAQTPVSEKAPTKPVFTSLAVADASALPTCDSASEGFLAYVKADKTIQACEDGAWAVIDLRGPKGDQGEAGPAAIAAQAVQTDPVPSMDQWLDPVTKRLWTTGVSEVAFSYAKTVCEGDWRLPTEAELTLAIARGMADLGSDAMGRINSRVIWAESGRATKNITGNDFISPAKATAYCIGVK